MSHTSKRTPRLAAVIVALATVMTVLAVPVAQAETVPPPGRQPGSIAGTLAGKYPVPSGAVFVSPTGSDLNPGTISAPLRTVNYAASKMKTGGTVVLRGGIYREGAAGHSTGGTRYLLEPKNLTIQAYPGEEAWMDGTVPVTSWSKTAAGKYKTPWSTTDFCNGAYYSRHYSDQTKTGPCSTSDSIGGEASLGDPQMVFVNGRQIREVASVASLTVDSFFYDWYTREIHLGFNPTGKTVEVTKHPQAMAMFKPSNVAIRGIGFRRYASNQYGGATAGALLLNGGSNVTLDRVVITESAGNGLLAWSTKNLTVRSSWLSSNGANGMNYSGSAPGLAKNRSLRDDLMIEYSRLDDNNTDSYGINCSFSCSASGFKGVGVVGAKVRYNTFNSNGGKQASGVFFDLDAKDVAIVGNEVIGNAGHGILYEVSDAGIIASNVIRNNGWNSVKSSSYGLMVGSANTKVYNNNITGNKYGVYLYDDSRSPGSKTGYDSSRVGPNSVNVSFVNNIVSAAKGSPYLMVVTGGSTSVLGNTSADQVVGTMDHNSYSLTASAYFFTWRQHEGGAVKVFDSLDSLRSAKNKEANGHQTTDAVDAHTAPMGAPLPADVAQALGQRSGAVLRRGVIPVGATSGGEDTPAEDSQNMMGNVGPDGLIAVDGFGSSVVSGWGSAETGGDWNASSMSAMSVVGSSAIAGFTQAGWTHSAFLNAVSASNVSVRTDFALNKTPVGGHYYHQALVRATGSSHYRLMVRLEQSGTVSVAIVKQVSGIDTILRTTSLPRFNYRASERINVQFDATGSGSVVLEGKVWRAGDPMPAAPTVSAKDSSATLKNGVLGLKMYTGRGTSSLPLTVSVDSFKAEVR